jgi:hypothetical protein
MAPVRCGLDGITETLLEAAGSGLRRYDAVGRPGIRTVARLRSVEARDPVVAGGTAGGFAELALVRYPHQPLSDRVWALRHNLSAYDATFVALAETLDAPLITCDARLASAPGHTARVELFAAS